MPPSSILPDTCAWIDFFSGKQTPLAEVLGQSLLKDNVVTCGVVIMELLQGVKSAREEALILDAFQALTHLEMTRDHWTSAGRLAAKLRAAGHNIPFSDLILAVLAKEHKCTLLTMDRHFELIPEISTM